MVLVVGVVVGVVVVVANNTSNGTGSGGAAGNIATTCNPAGGTHEAIIAAITKREPCKILGPIAISLLHRVELPLHIRNH